VSLRGGHPLVGGTVGPEHPREEAVTEFVRRERALPAGGNARGEGTACFSAAYCRSVSPVRGWPIYAASFVLWRTAAAAVMGRLPCHDQRDFEFARAHRTADARRRQAGRRFAARFRTRMEEAVRSVNGRLPCVGPLDGLGERGSELAITGRGRPGARLRGGATNEVPSARLGRVRASCYWGRTDSPWSTARACGVVGRVRTGGPAGPAATDVGSR